MHYSTIQNAYTVIFPAISSLSLSDSVKRFFTNGGCSLLAGETREEYVSRQMARQRKAEETPERMLQFTQQARTLSSDILIGVDQEISGICRLHNLVEPFPSVEELQSVGIKDFENISSRIGRAAKKLGINCVLGPIVDVVTGKNPWLEARTWTNNITKLTGISSAYIRSVQSCGVAAAAKHFPGYSAIERDPAIEVGAIMTGSIDSIEDNLTPFVDAIENKVEIIMTGPAIVQYLDPDTPASLSFPVITMLKERLNFAGLVLSDDLDAKATLRNQSIEHCAVTALIAGADLLLLADINNQIESVAGSIVHAVKDGNLQGERLDEAARKVRRVVLKYSKD